MQRLALLVLVLSVACEGSSSPTDAGPRVDAAIDETGEDASIDAAALPPDGGPRDAAALPDGGARDAGPPIDPIEGVGGATLVQGGFMFLEGPQWLPATGELVFSDIPANTIFVLRAGGAIETFRTPSGMSNGLELDVDGSLLAAEHGGRRVARGDYDGAPSLVVGAFEGDAFNSPNDLVVRSDGTIYFTDPPYGLAGRPRELDFVGVFRLAPSGTLVAEDRGALSERPNGIVLSPDERTLYVSDSEGDYVRAFDVASDGSLSGERMFVPSVPGPDGMAIDEAGNLYVSAGDGIRVYAPDGTRWGTIAVPMQPANCAFGGADRRTLYVTARAGLYRVEGIRVSGLL